MSVEPGPGGTPNPDDVPRLLEAMRAVGSGLHLRSTLERICETAAELADARYAAVGLTAECEEGSAGHGPDGRPCEDPEGPPCEDPEGRQVRWIGRLPAGHEGPGGSPAPGFLRAPIRVRGERLGTLHLAEKRDGGPFGDHDLDMVRVLAREAGIALGNARLYEAAKRRERWIDGSVAVTTALLSGGDADEALQVVAEQARRLSDSMAALVLLPAAQGGLEIVAVASERPSRTLGLVVPPENAVAGHLLAGRAVFIEDAARDPRMHSDLARGYGPTLLLPLQSSGRVLGSLVMARAGDARPFTDVERTLATQFASQAALALMMAEAQRDRERLAVFEDRDRIARDLHDLVIQRLFATGMLLESAQRRSVLPEVRRGVGKAVDELDVTIQEIRTAVFALQQGPAEFPTGLRTRVLREINMAAVPLGFTPSHRFVGQVDTVVGELTAKNLIAALREALSNAFRHAGASRIDVTVDATARLADQRSGVRLTVADDGVGIPEGGRRSGLKNLSRRAESLGGDSWYGPGAGREGGGTSVVWEAPY
ncbi:signal transduction histidine kinase [Streptomyces sp. V3I8]|uniref:GAF domain-containing sensor histidine kinase n=1 Tax=Streptomyces sp. V3I8 TaxID=3042279 RepID=UPI0027877D24|nr:GAF domain-containing protein [Streptomyces sp. V3I8]MDQ1037429.1 signal transduction histidine kinase [Streptomyces sp. V3I8]